MTEHGGTNALTHKVECISRHI